LYVEGLNRPQVVAVVEGLPPYSVRVYSVGVVANVPSLAWPSGCPLSRLPAPCVSHRPRVGTIHRQHRRNLGERRADTLAVAYIPSRVAFDRCPLESCHQCIAFGLGCII